jgi:hypothetical protein
MLNMLSTKFFSTGTIIHISYYYLLKQWVMNFLIEGKYGNFTIGCQEKVGATPMTTGKTPAGSRRIARPNVPQRSASPGN